MKNSVVQHVIDSLIKGIVGEAESVLENLNGGKGIITLEEARASLFCLSRTCNNIGGYLTLKDYRDTRELWWTLRNLDISLWQIWREPLNHTNCPMPTSSPNQHQNI